MCGRTIGWDGECGSAQRSWRGRALVGDDGTALVEGDLIARGGELAEPLFDVGAELADPAHVEPHVSLEPRQDRSQAVELVGPRCEREHLAAERQQLGADVVDRIADGFEQIQGATRRVSITRSVAPRIEDAASLTQVPENVGQPVAAVADTPVESCREPSLQPFEQRHRVVGQAVAEPLAAVVAVAAQLVGLGDAIDGAPVDELIHVLSEQHSVIDAEPLHRAEHAPEDILVQWLQLVIAAEQEQRIQHRQVPGRSLGGEHRRDPPAEASGQQGREPFREGGGSSAGIGRDQAARACDIVGAVELVAAIRAAIAVTPGARAALDAILDHLERTGKLPRTLTVDADADTIAALRAVFSARGVTPLVPGRARLELARTIADTGLALDTLLYAALGRTPRDPRAEALARKDALCRELAALPQPSHEITRVFLTDEVAAARAGTGDTWALAEAGDVARAAAIVADVATALDAILELRAPIRIANFAARVLGNSKALGPGSERARRL
ncbi:MAG: hypothetical protein ABI591_31740, partial [Kofleriaceae bacterium]